jgi:hypothetical protein
MELAQELMLYETQIKVKQQAKLGQTIANKVSLPAQSALMKWLMSSMV